MITQSSPRSLEAELRRLTAHALSTRSRYGHVALLLAALMMSALIGALLATEPALPDRTRIALTVMLGIGVGWCVYAIWVLRHRKPLLANHRVVAGWMAVTFTALFFVGASAMALTAGGPVYQAVAAIGAAMLAVAVTVLIQACRNFARLQARRRELERQLGL